MDLKSVQEDLKNDILNHQMLMQQLKKDPLNPILKLKLKAVQQHIAELGTKQKKILGNLKTVNNRANNKKEPTSEVKSGPNLNCEIKSPMPKNTLQTIRPKTEEKASSSKITLITIKNNNAKTATPSNFPVSASSDNVPMNLSCMPSKQIKSETPFATPSAVVVVSSQANHNQNNQIHVTASPSSTPLSISLSSLVSTGGVVTLAGGWKAQSQANNPSAADTFGRFVPGKQVQIKVPMMQKTMANPVIVMQQKPTNSATSKSFRLLPKGRHPIPVNQVRSNMMNGGQKITISNYPRRCMPGLSVISPKGRQAVLVQSEPPVNNPPPYHQVVVRRMAGNSTLSAPASTSTSSSVTWQDLSSKTPGIHKPSYVPRKSFPNINNGVGSFQKFRIFDGKPQMVTKPSQEAPPPVVAAKSSSSMQGVSKPKTSALKAVLTSDQGVSTQPGITYTRLLPKSIPKNGFYPIQPKELSQTKDMIKPQKSRGFTPSGGINSFVPVPTPSGSIPSSFVPVTSVLSQRSSNASTITDEETKQKMEFLRNIDLIPKDQADKLRSRRFRKRRVAANPVYSGGMYVSHEVESKRHCVEPIVGGLAGITPPDVIVKRPRGRPRGSTKLASHANMLLHQHQANSRPARTTTTSPIKPEHVEELRQLRGILDIVASASRAVSTAGMSEERAKKSTSASPDQQPQSIRNPPDNGKENDDDPDEHEDQCAACGRTGEVLMCDTCSRVYHLSCTTPPLAEVPQGMWICSICKTEFKNSKSGSKWPGIVSVVHAFMGHDKQREKEIEEEQEKLAQAKKMVNGLQLQTKTLTSAVMGKVSLRSKAMKEKQNVQKDITDFRSVIQFIWDAAMNTGDSTS